MSASDTPQIITPAARAASGAAMQQHRQARTGGRLLTGQWVREARERAFGPLDAWLKHGRTT